MAQHLPRPPPRPQPRRRLRGRPRRLPPPRRLLDAEEPVSRRAARPPRDLRRHPAGARRRRARLADDHARLRPLLHVLRGALRARARAQPAAGGAARRNSSASPAQGYREVVLLGQTVNSYRHEDTGLRRPAAHGLRGRGHRARPLHLAASRPTSSDAIIEAMRDCPKLSPHIHLPLQTRIGPRARSDAARLHRRASTARWWTGCATRSPDLALSTDIIVGFPGETDDDFEATSALMRRSASTRRSCSSTRPARARARSSSTRR